MIPPCVAAVADRQGSCRVEAVQLLFEGDADTAAEVMRAHIETSLGAKSAWRLAQSTTPTDQH